MNLEIILIFLLVILIPAYGYTRNKNKSGGSGIKTKEFDEQAGLRIVARIKELLKGGLGIQEAQTIAKQEEVVRQADIDKENKDAI